MQALGDDDTVGNNHSTCARIPSIVENEDDLYFLNWDGNDDAGGRESSSNDFGCEVDDYLPSAQ